MCALANLLWMKPIGVVVYFFVGILVLHRDPRYSLNRLFSLSFFLFAISQLFDVFKDIFWGLGFLAVSGSRSISIVTGIFATICFLLTGIHVRYGAYRTFEWRLLFSAVFTGGILTVIAIADQSPPTPDPIQMTVIIMGVAGTVALFVIPALFVLTSTAILFSTSRLLTNQVKQRSVLLLATGMLCLIIGAIAYALEALPHFFPWRLSITIFGLVAWMIGALISLFAFCHRFRS